LACLAEETVVAFIAGKLSPAQTAAVDEHAASCSACRQLLLVAAKSSSVAAAATMPLDILALSPTLAGTVTPGGGDGALAPGKAVGRYVIQSVLGKGGMGVVYAAFDPDLDRKVAVKLLHPVRSEGDGEAAAARLLREGRAIAKLAHPNVVAVFDVGTHDGTVFVAMELVDGVSLDRWIEEPRPWREVVDVFLQAGAGLVAAHSAGMVHRDFKPANVLMGKDGRVRVTDFGLARFGGETARVSEQELRASSDVDRLTRTGAIVGTPAYMSPQQFEAGEVDAATDQFSFAVALYEALYGERPFAGVTVGEVFANITAGKVRGAPAGTAVPGWLRQIVLRGLEPAAADRYPTLGEMLAELRKRTAGRKRTAVAGAAMLGVAGVAIAGVLAMRSGDIDVDCAGNADRELLGWYAARRSIATSKLLPDIDRVVADWRATSIKSCRTRHSDAVVRGIEQACLRNQLDRIEILGAEAVDASPEMEGGILDDIKKKEMPARCLDHKRTSFPVPLPADAFKHRLAITAHATYYRAEMLMRANADQIDRAEVLAREALRLAEQSGHLPTQANAWAVYGGVFNQRGDHDGSISAWRKAITAAERGEAFGTLAFAHVLLANEICNLPGRIGDCVAEIERAQAYFDRHPEIVSDQFALTRAGVEAARLRPELGLQQLAEWTRKHPEDAQDPYFSDQRAILENLDGRPGAALRTIESTLDVGRKANNTELFAGHLRMRCGYQLDLGNLAAARATSAELHALPASVSDTEQIKSYVRECDRMIAIEDGDLAGALAMEQGASSKVGILIKLGRLGEARAIVEPPVRILPGNPVDWSVHASRIPHLELLIAERKLDAAEAMIRDLDQALKPLPDRAYAWFEIALARAMLAILANDAPTARAALDRAGGLIAAREPDASAVQGLVVEIHAAEICARERTWTCTDRLRKRLTQIRGNGSRSMEVHFAAALALEATVRAGARTPEACAELERELAALAKLAATASVIDRKRIAAACSQ
jgi:tetratricopeptide (TPR) repeat protein